jgi:hypothetical protein
MKAAAATLMILLLAGCGSDPHGAVDSGRAPFPCDGYWICGGDVTRIDLKPEVDGCYLSGLLGRNLLSPDGTIVAEGAVVGKAAEYGTRVRVFYPDGTEWLFCVRVPGAG